MTTIEDVNVILTPIIQIIGVLGNIIVIFKILCDKKLHTITFVTLASLAVADGLVLSSFLTAYFIGRFLKLPETVKLLYTVCNLAVFSSGFHVSFIAVVRYFVIVHPLKTFVYFKVKNIVVCSCCIYFLSSIIAGVDYAVEDTLEFTIAMWAIYYLPMAITILLHLKKFRHLQKNNSQESSLRKNSANSSKGLSVMSRIIIVVFLSSILLPLPACILAILKYGGIRVSKNIGIFVSIFFTLNSCINPFLYCFMSPKFRKSLKTSCTRKMGAGSRLSSLSSNNNTMISVIHVKT